MRKDFDPAEIAPHVFYRLLTATVVPRPIAWVSSTSAAGVDNLAPHSFFTVASTSPAVLQFTSVGRKDTLRNVEETGQFVVNLSPEELFEQVNETGTDFPPEVSEFDAAGLTREPSLRVRPPRVAESPVSFECELHSTLGFGGSTVVFGRVVHLAVAEAVLDGDHPVIDRLRPLARLGRDEWSTMGEVRELRRPRYSDRKPR
ncbi:flavin reductase (DIM6/NTAB) family NADH-FMN oxidoreductase RutF [Amycolatopsis sulphurea]|uniref:Flavin reductase (DIM6/NTAB) family NADH-FMN oxidoreductase RutF n=1 Tax=Amycolatopsis sulphurea TaxID=76022 RepID=A0A2A9FFZ8_9PSEU|nr:flavin reductase family protein [Amycolatopsis sulphurea]PFG49696.1 flavin reductase (DIM6/NTAB) family NADH-FMN oxidoreductase RutF [Amycolatopsis sulphurea]